MKKLFLYTLLLMPLLLCQCGKQGGDGGGEEPEEPEPTPVATVPAITGSFIQHWYVAGWGSTQWDTEMAVLKEAGIEYLIFTPVKDREATAPDYPALEKCLAAAEKKGIRVFVGPNADDRWWNSGISGETLNALQEEGLAVAAEIYSRYHDRYPTALYGWYWDWEVDNATWNRRQDLLVGAWNITLDGLSELDGSMPLLFSPFMNPEQGAPAAYRDFWKAVFPKLHLRKGDIFAPQDSIGATGMSLSAVKAWFSMLADAAKTVDGLQFWANAETFEQFNVHGESRFVTSSLERIVGQLKAEAPFVDRIICFAYSHYLSPVLVREDYHKAYRDYVKTGELPEIGKTGRVNSAVRETGTGVALSWSIATKTDVDGFAIYKNGALLIKLQIREGNVPGYFFDYDGKAADIYEISTYNILGVESPKVSFQ